MLPDDNTMLYKQILGLLYCIKKELNSDFWIIFHMLLERISFDCETICEVFPGRI